MPLLLHLLVSAPRGTAMGRQAGAEVAGRPTFSSSIRSPPLTECVDTWPGIWNGSIAALGGFLAGLAYFRLASLITKPVLRGAPVCATPSNGRPRIPHNRCIAFQILRV